MNLKILLPFGIFLQEQDVLRIVADTGGGSLGLLPHRLDCVAALMPGILSYGTQDGVNHYVALDEGVLIKAGDEVLVSVRRAIGGTDLAKLHDTVIHEFMTETKQEQESRAAVAKMESGLVGRFAEFQHDR
jgi:F-type H+-transporting ATPase subunit epsilon